MSNVLVTGANGQLGREIKKLRNLFGQVYHFTDVDELDVSRPDALKAYIQEQPVDFIVNCAAYTDVDRAESEPELAGELNREVIRHMVSTMERYPELRVIHISTDYVFGGELLRPLREDDPTNPLSLYGKTKLEGELLVRDHPRALVIRTSWLYSMFGKNFVKSMINRMDHHDELRVVYDQIGTPTYAEDLARAVMQIIADVDAGHRTFQPGLFHFSNEGVCSWFDLAIEICRMINCRSKITPVETSEYPVPAKRPPYSVLNKARIKEVYGVEVPYWRDSLEKCLKNLM
jgi:dTDP-4-dehydrorhamnose reductase